MTLDSADIIGQVFEGIGFQIHVDTGEHYQISSLEISRDNEIVERSNTMVSTNVNVLWWKDLLFD